MKKVTAKDVAKRAGVSPATVSMILNNKGNVSFSAETIERVTRAARQLNYTVPSFARPSEHPRKNLIALFMATLNNPYYPMVNQTVEENVLPHGYHLIIYNIHKRSDIEKYYLDVLVEDKVDGIVYTFSPTFPRLLEKISRSIPVVIIGEKDDNLHIHTVGLNKYKAGILVAEHLIQLGHQHIAYITPPMEDINMILFRKRRLQGIMDTIKAQGLEEKFVLKVFPDETEHSDNIYEIKVGYELTLELLQETPVSAIIGMNDMVACGIMKALSEKGYKVPQQISVCGFDNIFVSSILTPTLTTIDHCIQHRVKIALDILLENIENVNNDAGVYKIEYEPQLVVRNSTGPCKMSLS